MDIETKMRVANSLAMRCDRFIRLHVLDAPKFLIDREEELIAQAIDRWNNETQESADEVQRNDSQPSEPKRRRHANLRRLQ